MFRWIPAHSDLIENDKAHLAAKSRAEKGGKQAESWSSLAYIKKNVSQIRGKELTSWHERKTQERETSRHGFYIPWTKAEINPVLGKTPKKYAARYYQLKVGHGAVGTYLSRTGMIGTPECWWCGAQEQTVIHLYTECRKWRKERRKLSRELSQLGISWQPRPERRWLGRLLANERAIGPVLEFLKRTEVGSRAGAKEREMEWQGRNDQEGENLVSD